MFSRLPTAPGLAARLLQMPHTCLPSSAGTLTEQRKMTQYCRKEREASEGGYAYHM